MAKHATYSVRDLMTLNVQLHVRDWAGLSERQKEIYNLRILHGCSLSEVADTLGWSYWTVAKESVRINAKIDALFSSLIEEHSDGGHDLRDATGLDITKLNLQDYLT